MKKPEWQTAAIVVIGLAVVVIYFLFYFTDPADKKGPNEPALVENTESESREREKEDGSSGKKQLIQESEEDEESAARQLLLEKEVSSISREQYWLLRRMELLEKENSVAFRQLDFLAQNQESKDALLVRALEKILEESERAPSPAVDLTPIYGQLTETAGRLKAVEEWIAISEIASADEVRRLDERLDRLEDNLWKAIAHAQNLDRPRDAPRDTDTKGKEAEKERWELEGYPSYEAYLERPPDSEDEVLESIRLVYCSGRMPDIVLHDVPVRGGAYWIKGEWRSWDYLGSPYEVIPTRKPSASSRKDREP